MAGIFTFLMALVLFERGRKGVGVVDAEQEFGGPRKRRDAELHLGIFWRARSDDFVVKHEKRKDRRVV